MSRRSPFLTPLFFRLFIPFGLAYFLAILIGSAGAIMSPILIATFDLSPLYLGFMSSVYLVSFGVTQIPLGVMLDRYGACKTLTPLLLFAVAGTLLFSFSTNLIHLVLSKVLLGIGLAGCLMSSFKAYADWMDADALPLAYSLQSFAGGVGAMVATRPLAIAFEVVNWRIIFFGFAAAVFMAALLVFFVVPQKKTEESARPNISTLKLSAKMIGFLCDGRFWAVAPLSIAAESVLFAYLFLWLGPWLRDVARFSEVQTGRYLLFSSAGVAVGYLLNGILADFLRKKGWMSWEKLYLSTGICMTLALGFIAFGEPVFFAPLWPFVMFLATMTMISFPLMRNRFRDDEVGRILSLLNLAIFFASFFMQWLVGAILELYPAAADGHFSAAGYRVGLALLTLLNFAASAHYYYVNLKSRA